jgi:hypothetical protein
MEKPFASMTHNSPWIVCLTHAKRLHNCIWERMHETPPDVMHVASKLCDQCLSEGSGHVTKTIPLLDSSYSHVDMCSR